jgi:hypothetical protein
MRIFSEFLELLESSTGESGKRRLAPKGPLKNRFYRSRQRRETADKVALKKAGFKRSANKDSYGQDHQISSSKYHDTNIETYKSQSDYASDNLLLKRISAFPIGGEKPRPTKERVRQAKAIRKQLGGDRTSKPVHDVSIHTKDDTPLKNDPDKLISRGKSFKQEVRAVPDALKKSGAKPGDKVASQPEGILRGEDRKEGAKKRGKIYAKELGSKMNPKTGKTMGTVRLEMKTFQEFLEESALARLALKGIGKAVSRASRVTRTADGGRRVTSAARRARTATSKAVAPKGPPAGRESRRDYRDVNSDLAAFKKAKFNTNKQDIKSRIIPAWDDSGRSTEPKRVAFDDEPNKGSVKDYSDSFYTTTVSKHKNQATYAQRQIPDKTGYEGEGVGNIKHVARPTAKRAFFLKQLRKQMGGTRTPKSVADIEIGSKSDYYSKNDPDGLVARGKDFVATLKDVPDKLRRSGVEPGSKVTGHPAAVMRGENDRVLGREKRAKLYKKIAGSRMSKMNPITQTLVGTAK